MGGSSSFITIECGDDTGGLPVPPEAVQQEEKAAWEAFCKCAIEQCWGPSCELSGAEQFQAMVDELNVLGLPVQGRPMP